MEKKLRTLALAGMMIGCSAFAQSPLECDPEITSGCEPALDSSEFDVEPDYFDQAFGWLVDKRNQWSGDISDIGARLDGFMGGDEAIQRANSSFLKITLEGNHSKFRGFDFSPRFRIRVDLPLTKDRYKIILETEPDQEKNLEERSLSSLPSTNEATNDGLYGSFRYSFKPAFLDQLSLDAGVKIRIPPDPFVRAKGNRAWGLTENWRLRYDQEVFLFESTGLGVYSKIDIERPLRGFYFVRSSSAVDWKERQERFDMVQQFSFFHDIDDKRAVQYTLGFSAYHDDGAYISNAFVSAKYRRRLYEEWLYYELRPGVEFPREFEFSSNPFIALKLEILFAKFDRGELSGKLY